MSLASATASIVIVRHPFSRVVSAYYDKFVKFEKGFEAWRKKAIKNFRPGGDLVIAALNGTKLKEQTLKEGDPQLPT